MDFTSIDSQVLESGTGDLKARLDSECKLSVKRNDGFGKVQYQGVPKLFVFCYKISNADFLAII